MGAPAAAVVVEDRARTGDEMTARDWVEVVLRGVLAYPLLVLILFLLRPLGWDIEPLEDAFTGIGPAMGVSLAERWRQNRATDRNARLARGEAATMRPQLQRREGTVAHPMAYLSHRPDGRFPAGSTAVLPEKPVAVIFPGLGRGAGGRKASGVATMDPDRAQGGDMSGRADELRAQPDERGPSRAAVQARYFRRSEMTAGSCFTDAEPTRQSEGSGLAEAATRTSASRTSPR